MVLEKAVSANKRHRETVLEDTRNEVNRQMQKYHIYARQRRTEIYIPVHRNTDAEKKHADILQQTIKLETLIDNIKIKTQAPSKEVDN